MIFTEESIEAQKRAAADSKAVTWKKVAEKMGITEEKLFEMRMAQLKASQHHSNPLSKRESTGSRLGGRCG